MYRLECWNDGSMVLFQLLDSNPCQYLTGCPVGTSSPTLKFIEAKFNGKICVGFG